MRPLITVTARESFLYEGRAMKQGDVFTVTPLQAAALKYQARVVLGEHPELAPQPEPTPEPRKKRAYRRRDLTAER